MVRVAIAPCSPHLCVCVCLELVECILAAVGGGCRLCVPEAKSALREMGVGQLALRHWRLEKARNARSQPDMKLFEQAKALLQSGHARSGCASPSEPPIVVSSGVGEQSTVR